MATPRSKYGRSEWNQALKLDPRCDNTISEMDEKKHAELRYMLSHGVRYEFLKPLTVIT
jgi:hypothetical protein